MSSGRTPEDYRRLFAEVLSELDAHPRRTGVKVWGAGLTVDFEDGNPVFKMAGEKSVKGDFRRRWLPEHSVPLVFRTNGPTVIRLVPTTGNRVKFRV